MSLWRRLLLALGLVREPGATSLHPAWASSKLYGALTAFLLLGAVFNVLDGVHSAWDWFELVVGLTAAGLIGTAARELRREDR